MVGVPVVTSALHEGDGYPGRGRVAISWKVKKNSPTWTQQSKVTNRSNNFGEKN